MYLLQSMPGMVPIMKHPVVSGEVKNGLHVYSTASYPQSMHLSQMQSAYVHLAGK